MSIVLSKMSQRLAWIGAHGIHQLLAPLGQFMVSWVVLKMHSAELWGEIVAYILVINTLMMFVNWGHRTYLIKVISERPQTLAQLWQRTLWTRILLLLLSVVVIFFLYKKDVGLWYLIFWMLGSFFYLSFDPIHLYFRKFIVPIVVEVFSLLIITGVLIYYCQQLSLLLLLQLYTFLAIFKAIVYVVYYQKELLSKLFLELDFLFFKEAFPFFAPAMIGFIQSRMDLYGVAYYLPKKELGEYQIFFQILMLFILGMGIVLGPFLKNIYRMPFDSLMRLNRQFMLGGIILIAPALSLLSFLLPIIYKINYEASIYILSYAMLVFVLSYILLTHILIKFGKELELVWLFGLGALSSFGMNYFLIPYYGVLGAILSSAIIQVALFLAFSYRVYLLKEARE